MSAEWLQWYYLIYLLPAAVAVLVLLMTGASGHHGGHSHAAHGGLHLHAHHGSGHEGAAAHHAGHSGAHGHAPAAPGHAAGRHGHSGDHNQSRSPGAGQHLLGFFGVGRAPLTIVIGSLMIGWGLIGLAVTDTLRRDLHWPPVLFVGPALAAAAAGSLAAAKLFGELSARLMPKDESFAIGREGLLGLTGKVVYRVTETGGRVHVFDQYRTLHVKPARVGPGEAPIAKGTEVIVASMEPERGTLIVEPLGFHRSAASSPPSTVSQKSEREVQVREAES
jgi:membrane protein implicated in regulation of membrane protease activity